uniref:OmpH family outer membrane protein n=1 Tax=Candidatus Profftia sp. (ex Adelges kitamiensis) TaxID=2864218 RepID=UPI001CE26F72|nr:OmpH family outer membrane protein [Candidatus Profftia sp. (ex Adelges kitamiensis)]
MWIYIVSLLGSLLLVSVHTEAAYKIGIVKVSSIFQQLPQRTVIAKKLETEFNDRAMDLQRQEREIQSKIQKLQRDGSTMKASDRTKMEKDIMAQRDIFFQHAQVFEQDNRRRQAEENNKLLSRIQDAVSIIAKDKGYDLVIDANAVAYTNSSYDITAQVLKQVK